MDKSKPKNFLEIRKTNKRRIQKYKKDKKCNGKVGIPKILKKRITT